MKVQCMIHPVLGVSTMYPVHFRARVRQHLGHLLIFGRLCLSTLMTRVDPLSKALSRDELNQESKDSRTSASVFSKLLVDNLQWALSTLPQAAVQLSGRRDAPVFLFRKMPLHTDERVLATRLCVQLLRKTWKPPRPRASSPVKTKQRHCGSAWRKTNSM